MKSEKTQFFQKLDPHLPASEAGDEGIPEPAFDLLPEALKSQFTVIPAEHVALHLIDLPIRSARQQREALPFALEEGVSRPLDQTHFAICERVPDGQVLAAAVDKAVMARVLAAAPDRIVIPEQILLPTPPDSDGAVIWRAYRQGDRVLVRASDGTGFVTHSTMLAHLWQASGRPQVVSFGNALPGDISWTDRSAEDLPGPESPERYDLRQGAYRPSLGLQRPLMWLAASVVLALITHIALAMADLRAQTAIADDLRVVAASLLAERLPDASVEATPTLIQRQIAAQSQPQLGSSFLPLMNRVSQAWLRDGAPVQIRQLSWSEDALRLVVEAPDLDALQRAEASLAAQDLAVSSGSATADAGSARAELVVRP